MPSRETKKPHHPTERQQKNQLLLRPTFKQPHGRHSPAGHATRINAFVNSMGRRNQAKRDSR